MKKNTIIYLLSGIVLTLLGLLFIRLGISYAKTVVTFCGISVLVLSPAFGTRCNLKFSGVALGISITVALGIHSVLSFLSCYFLTHPKYHPVRHPVSFVVGIICFIVFSSLCLLYIVSRKKNFSVVGVALDVVFGLLHLPAFYFCFLLADSFLTYSI